MKAIKITQQLKNLNPSIFGGAVDTIKTFGLLPNVFFRPLNNGARTDAYQTLSDAIHEADGFFDVVTPQDGIDYDSSVQKLGALFFDVDKFTYPIIALTQQEIDDLVAQEADSTADEQESTRQTDGEAEARYIYKMLRKLKNAGTLTANQFIQAQDLMFDALSPMAEWGLWDVSKSRLTAISDPANATLLNILNQIRARITYYVNNGTRDNEV